VTVRIDLARKTITVSPATLLGGASRRIGFDRGEGFERLWIGQAVHRRVLGDFQDSIPGYHTEKGVKLTFPVDDFTATFEGRLDGRYHEVESGRVVVDEVKSIHFSEDLSKLVGSPRFERFQLQLRWYLLAVASEGHDVVGRLVLADIESGRTQIHAVIHDAERTLRDLCVRIRALIDERLSMEALAEAKAAEAKTIRFPFEVWRPGQREMMTSVGRAAYQGDHLLVEAPTGIGKTAASLTPLLRAALASNRRLFILTAKTTQQEMFTKTLATIEGDSFRSVRLRAKERMCANDVVLCHESHCAYAKDYGAKMEASGLLERLLDSERHLDPDLVFEEARREVVCPFEVSLELAERADLVIGDYNYIFDPIVSLAPARDPLALADAILLVDEAHNLVDRGRGYYSPELRDETLNALERSFGLSSAKTAQAAEDAARAIRQLVSEATASLPEANPGEEISDLVSLSMERLDEIRLELEALFVRHLADLRTGGERVPDDPVAALYFDYARFHDVARLAMGDGTLDAAFDILASNGPNGRRLSILCKDPSKQLARVINGASSTIAMSATLSPPEFYRDLLGFDSQRTDILKLPSPFPKENRTVVVTTDIDTTYSSRERSAPKLAALLEEIARSCPGNVLALFPSYRYLDDVRRRMPPLPGRRVLRPSDRSTELERRDTLQAMRDGGSPVMLMAVSGGAFAEGVDYPGEMLHAVIVVSPALPQVRFEQERMRLYFEERYEKGFEYAYVIPGMTRVVQSAGRLIRSESDVGVIVLACKRFLREPYRRYLPAEWYVENPKELAETDPGAVTAAFFARVKRNELPVRALPVLSGR